MHAYEKRSYKKVAEYFMVTPQGVSKMIRSIEEELGEKLFVKEKNRLIASVNERVAQAYLKDNMKILKLDDASINDRICIMHYEKMPREAVVFLQELKEWVREDR